MSRLHTLLWVFLLACGGTSGASGGRAAGGLPRAESHGQGDGSLVSSDGDRSAAYFALPNDEGLELEGALLAPMPVAVTSFGAAYAQGALYVLGGYAGRPHVYHREAQSPSLWRHAGDRWEEVSRLPHGIQGAPLVEWNGRVCRLGGTRILNAAGEPLSMQSVGAVECFDAEVGRWSLLPSLPEPRSSFDAARVGERLCVAGGWRLNGVPDEGEWSDDMQCLHLTDPSSGWQSVPAPFRRRALAVRGVDEALVVIGGLDPDGEISSAVDVYDFRRGQWARGPDFPEPAFGVAAAAFDGSIYASAASGTVYEFTPSDSEWTRVTSLAYRRFFHQLVVADAGIVAIGGVGGMHGEGRVRHVERLRLSADDSRLSVWSMPWPGSSRNRQARFVDGEYLYLFGGNNSLGQHDFEPSNFVDEGWRVHLPSMRIEAQEPYPSRRQTMAVVRQEQNVVVVGGFGHDGTHAVSQPESYVFSAGNEADAAWRPGGRLEASRTQFGIAANEQGVWLFGGLNYDPRRQGDAAFEHVTSILRQDRLSGAFVDTGLRMPGPRRAFAGAMLDDRYYIVGGMRESFTLVDDCQQFDLQQERFSELPCPEAPRLSGDLVALHGKLYLVGGSTLRADGIEENRNVEVFDPSHPDQGWRVLLELPFSTTHARAMAFQDRLLVTTTHFEDPRMLVALIDVSEP